MKIFSGNASQSGQTGTRIAPDIYIASGISGAIQHWVGAMAAKNILAINTDSEANMVARAGHAVIGDLLEGCYDDWLLLERERLRLDYLKTLEQLSLLHKQRQDFNRALHNGFKKIWITGVAAIVLLLLSVYLTEGSFDVFTGNDLTSDENLISYIIYEDFNK
jgi:hypothetical protein